MINFFLLLILIIKQLLLNLINIMIQINERSLLLNIVDMVFFHLFILLFQKLLYMLDNNNHPLFI